MQAQIVVLERSSGIGIIKFWELGHIMQGILETLRKCPFTLIITVITLMGFFLFESADIEFTSR